MDGVFWQSECGFVIDRGDWSHFPDRMKIERADIDPILSASGRLPSLGPAPVASWVVARLFHLTGERLGIETHARLRNDGGGVPLRFIAFTPSLQPLAFLFLHCDSWGIDLSGECAGDALPEQITGAFISALLEKPNELTVCKLVTIDTDPPDLPHRRRGKPHVFGWDGEKLLGFRIEEDKIFAREEGDSTRTLANQVSADPNARKLIIDISETLVPSINGAAITTAPSVEELHAMLGSPSRILEPKRPAPVGHRNNRLHVYDDLGLVFWEHHYTRRIDHCQIVLCPDELQLLGDQAPPRSFPGTLRIEGFVFPPGVVDLDAVLNACPMLRPTRQPLAKPGNRFSVHLRADGYTLPSGHRTKRQRVFAIELSWPHDPWGQPVLDEPRPS